MQELIHPLADAFAALYSSPEDPLLVANAETTRRDHPHAHMLSGHVQGKFLSLLSKMLMPRRILEIGTFSGYSALCLADGLHPEGILHTIELREEDAAKARNWFNQNERGRQIILHTGNALEIIPALQESWDLVFIDADKPGYIDYYELALPRVRTGGILIADNMLFHGQVLSEPVQGKNAEAILAFNKHVKNDERVEHVLLTIRDGIQIIRKK